MSIFLYTYLNLVHPNDYLNNIDKAPLYYTIHHILSSSISNTNNTAPHQIKNIYSVVSLFYIKHNN